MKLPSDMVDKEIMKELVHDFVTLAKSAIMQQCVFSLNILVLKKEKGLGFANSTYTPCPKHSHAYTFQIRIYYCHGKVNNTGYIQQNRNVIFCFWRYLNT